MQIHQLTKSASSKSRKRIGRGGKRGTYSGHGGKGQTARSGRNFRPIVREVLKRYPKLRGHRNRAARADGRIVNVALLEAKFEKGSTITPSILAEKNIVGRVGGKSPRVKILGQGDVSKNFNIFGCEVSAAAREKIEKAGGAIKN
jgi:large subunit ribosomal protein L15